MHEDTDINEHRATRLRAARIRLGWSQRQLATASCLPQRTVARLEFADGRPSKRTVTA